MVLVVTRIRDTGWKSQSISRMDHFEGFQYFITNLMLHNVVLVVVAGLLGLVLGRVVFGTSKAGLQKLREALKTAEMRADEADRDFEKMRTWHAELEEGTADLELRLKEQVERAKPDGELEKLQAASKALEQRVAKAEASAKEHEKRIEETIKEREQVEKASAVLRMEMRGLRNKMKEVEQQEHQVAGLESALKEAEERLVRSQVTVAKESRVKTSLEKMVEELEGKLAEATSEQERGRDETGTGPPARDSGADSAEAGTGAPTEREEPPAVVRSDSAGEELIRLKGVGAVLAKKLRDSGVTTLQQIADWTDEDLEKISKRLRLGNRPSRGDWRGQARALCRDE